MSMEVITRETFSKAACGHITMAIDSLTMAAGIFAQAGAIIVRNRIMRHVRSLMRLRGEINEVRNH